MPTNGKMDKEQDAVYRHIGIRWPWTHYAKWAKWENHKYCMVSLTRGISTTHTCTKQRVKWWSPGDRGMWLMVFKGANVKWAVNKLQRSKAHYNEYIQLCCTLYNAINITTIAIALQYVNVPKWHIYLQTTRLSENTISLLL